MKWEAAACTHVGRRRSQNEDAYLLQSERGLFVVADGMGGHAAGEVASRMTVECIEQRFCPAAPGDVSSSLADAVRAANLEIWERAGREADKNGMGTTATALALTPQGTAHLAHAGDSRAYLLRYSELRQLTTDHTWVQQQITAGALAAEQARNHPFASIVTRALGTQPDIEVDVLEVDLQSGDRLLLCSDGVTGMIEDARVAELLGEDRKLDSIAKRLVQAANRAGGRDNSTVIVVRVTE